MASILMEFRVLLKLPNDKEKASADLGTLKQLSLDIEELIEQYTTAKYIVSNVRWEKD